MKTEQFEKALKSLEKIISEPYSVIVRDATIQRFEYTFEICWKTLRLYLNIIHGIVCNSPKSCFREGFTIGLYNEEMTETFLNMVDDRNQTTHIYDEKEIEEIYNSIKSSYFPIMETLLKSIKT